MKSDRSVEQLPCNREDPTARKRDRSSQWIRQNSNAIVTGSWVHLGGSFPLLFPRKDYPSYDFSHTSHHNTPVDVCGFGENLREGFLSITSFIQDKKSSTASSVMHQTLSSLYLYLYLCGMWCRAWTEWDGRERWHKERREMGRKVTEREKEREF